METVKIDNLVRSRRRSVSLIVNSDATLTVRAPLKMPFKEIEGFLNQKSEWVARKIVQAQSRPKQTRKEFLSGEKFLYLGHEYPLQIVDGLRSGLEFSGAFRLARASQVKARSIFYHWYQYQAKNILNDRVKVYAQTMGLDYRAIKINDAKTRWGSCASSGNLNFTWRLIMAPLFVLDYVVVHELAHIPIKNHSRRFWEKVKMTMPQYQEAVVWLNHNGGLLTFS